MKRVTVDMAAQATGLFDVHRFLPAHEGGA